MDCIIGEGQPLLVANSVTLGAVLFWFRLFWLGRVLMRYYREDSRRVLRGLHINRKNFSLGDVAFDGPTVGAIRHRELDGIFRAAGDLGSPIHTIARGTKNI